MKHLPVLLSVPAILGLSMVLRTDPRGPQAASPAGDPAASPAEPNSRSTAHEAAPAASAADKGEPLLAARVAFGCGACLLTKARETEGPTTVALLELAVQQFRACLTYETSAATARELFADARRQLGQAKDLLERIHPPRETKATAAKGPNHEDERESPRRPELLPTPQDPPPATPAPAARVPANPKQAEPLMVGPDGVIYRRDPRGR